MPLKFLREGIRYDELSEEEKDEWDALEWDEDGDVPDRSSRGRQQVALQQGHGRQGPGAPDDRGHKVAGGDRLGKTIIFAKNQAHAEFIEERFDVNYPHCRRLRPRHHPQTQYAQSLIDDFSIKDKAPHIAISVDMLDTGIDVPEVVNLVFFKLVRSKTKFWQMIGRGTRLCPDLFGPGQDKEYFHVFDYCQNLEFFGANPEVKEAGTPKSLSERLFAARLDLGPALDKKQEKASRRRPQTPYEFGEAGGPPRTRISPRGRHSRVARNRGRNERRQLHRAAKKARG